LIVTRADWQASRLENGIHVKAGENYEFVFVPHVVFLSDHEAVRASMGCKGSAGFKPCAMRGNFPPMRISPVWAAAATLSGHLGYVMRPYTSYTSRVSPLTGKNGMEGELQSH